MTGVDQHSDPQDHEPQQPADQSGTAQPEPTQPSKPPNQRRPLNQRKPNRSREPALREAGSARQAAGAKQAPREQAAAPSRHRRRRRSATEGRPVLAAPVETTAVHHVLTSSSPCVLAVVSPRSGTASRSCRLSGRRLRAAGVRGRPLADADLGQFLRPQPRSTTSTSPGRLRSSPGSPSGCSGTKRTIIICVAYQIGPPCCHRPGVPDLPQLRLGLGGPAGHRDRRRFLRRHAGRRQRGQRDRSATVAASDAVGDLGVRAVLDRVRRPDGGRRARHRGRAQHAVLVQARRAARTARPGRCRPGTSCGCWPWSACC